MFEGFKWPTSFVAASQAACTGMAEAGARERASESGYRKVTRGTAGERAVSLSTRDPGNTRSQGEASLSAYANRRIERDHRGIKQRYYPMLGFGALPSAQRFCRAFEEVRQYFRPR